MGIVGIALQEPSPAGSPRGSKIDAMLVLHTAALAEAAGMKGCVALVVITMDGGQGQGIGHPVA